ncbi:ATP-binding protein [Bizionia sediminis]|uniref:histidine kinase n=1 Tax=Bizionia sediminis TaxID=1737064 RepID=A0ABW5KX66_9FLAO
MRRFLVVIIFCFSSFSYAQDLDLKANKKLMDLSNQKSSGWERLKFLDSLADEIRYNTPWNNDSIYRVTISYAQQLDSLDIAIKQATRFINYLNFGRNNLPEAKQVVNGIQSIITNKSNPELLDDFYYEAAEVYAESREFDEAIKLFDSSHYYAKQYNSPYVALSKYARGVAHVNNGKFGEASLDLQEAAALFQKNNDTVMWLNAKNSISILYSKNGFFEAAKKEREELAELAKTVKSYQSLPNIYFNMAVDDAKNNNQIERIKNLKRALKKSETSRYKDFFEIPYKATLVVALAENDSLKQATKLFNSIREDTTKLTPFNRPFFIDAQMRLAYAKKDYPTALQYGQKLYNMRLAEDQYEELQEAELFMSDVHNKLNNFELALKHYKNYTTIKDSIGSIQKTRILAYYQTLYETEKRDLIIENQESNIALLDAKNDVKNQWILFGSLGLIAFFGFVISIRSRKEYKKRQKLQEIFTQDIIKTQEQERTRLALELHDSVGQELMLLTRKLKTINNQTYNQLAQNTLTNLRGISQGLYPITLERFGFTTAIKNMVHDIDENTEEFFTLEIEDVNALISKDAALHVYRMLQEILNNTIKHAKAKAVHIKIYKKDNELIVSVKDNGQGFNYANALKTSKSLGMKSLVERSKIINATLQVQSNQNKGTQITIKLPV